MVMFFEPVITYRAFPILAFLIPLVVRAVPEILIGPYIVGFDTLGYYVPNVLKWLREGIDFWNFIAVTPLFYAMLMGATSIGTPIVIWLKVMPPLLHGFLGLAVYFYARKGLSWSPKKSLLVALVATLYFVALRVSWDMLKNELGLIFLFAALTFLHKSGIHWKYGVLLSLAMILVVLSHPLVAVVMFAIVVASILRLRLDNKSLETRILIVSSVPAALLFLVVAYANYVVSSSFSVVSGFPARESEGWLALFGAASHSEMAANNFGFLVFCYLPLLPLLVLGFRRFGSNIQMKAWVLWIFIALSSVVISPNAFIPGLHRWTLMLTYPFAFCATEAITHLKSNLNRIFVGLTLATLTLGFAVLPNRTPFPYYTMFPYYVPTSMLQNTVPSSDCYDTVNALQWLRSNMHDDARLLAHDVFYGWSLLTLDESRVIPIGYENPEKMAQKTIQNGSGRQLYLIWWTDGNGWHGQPTVSSTFEEVYESGRIAIYTFKPSVYHDTSDSEEVRSIKP